MNASILKAMGLAVSISLVSQGGIAASLHKDKSLATSNETKKNLSPIEQALIQQKRERYENQDALSNDQLKLMIKMKTPPTQSFFAAQHESFSRFVQSLFYSQSS